ncbi:putative cytosolic protein [Roseomonas mucosa]|jgi:tellurite resistance protein|uniref:Tellurite resistance protein n=2 Tax=Roseomonas mucosa TaxID=207340 RepID=A0A379N424_9PROT|nr:MULTISPECIES: tellurite resistance TerB family protein [Roseomonas]AWV23682.1 putative cytosolic protein [Roseomonas mucosa]MCG7353657.1 tellurite resistance TerB family protein [Roseomonas mucosa]MCG7357947.1 tellurite resistance TerB family protein [Roseomonas mucosa]MDT8275803.1 tellurite resistance TerB family protein [Roseomonas mucosa]MDT8288879.1 tellurite resistance TerB family protein [Roseomonas mucosa]
MPLDMSSPQATPVRLSAQEALVGAMVVMSACDGHMTDAELATMSRLVKELPVFSDFHVSGIETVTEIVLNLLGDTDGLDEVVALIRDALPQRLRETAYLLACEIVAADGDATQDELRFLQDFRIGLDIDRLVAGAIERAAKARYQVI